MHLTKKSSYGLIAILELANASEDAPRSASQIAKQYSLPASFVEKIFHELRTEGLICSKQGRAGGYYLAKPANDITVREVLESLGESLDLVGCLSGEANCDLDHCCPTQGAWRQIDHRFKTMLESLSLQSLVQSTLDSR